MPLTLPFAILNAFTTRLDGGNPAAVILTTPEEDTALTDDQRLAVARNLNQPMHIFVTPRKDDPEAFRVRWVMTTGEVTLCGHATFCTSGLFFNEKPGSTFYMPGANVARTLKFNGLENSLTGSKLDDGKIEIALEVAQVDELDRENPRAVKLRAAVAAACGPDLRVTYLGVDRGQTYAGYSLIEVDTDNLGALAVDTHHLRNTGFTDHIFTALPSASARKSGIAFEARVFAPVLGVDEDPVCGSAHALLAPYWTAKLGTKGQTMHSHQVSARGGDLWVRLDEDKGLVHLAGHVVKIVEGTVMA
ncbi:Diaminopimelate epimerase-like protein [Peniophora sp. CONT]|nr:Diaminopimelate epimerase-like protein [Peniophora sp. CONT]